jgi:MFS transporter, ACS family, glucarate transporter
MTAMTVQAGARPTAVRWWIAGGLILPVTFVMALDRTAMVVSAPVIQKEFGFSLNEMSIILTAFTWSYALFQARVACSSAGSVLGSCSRSPACGGRRSPS